MSKRVLTLLFLLLTLVSVAEEKKGPLSAEVILNDSSLTFANSRQPFSTQDRATRAFVDLSNNSSKKAEGVVVIGTFIGHNGEELHSDKRETTVDRRSKDQVVLFWQNPARILVAQVRVEITYNIGDREYHLTSTVEQPQTSNPYNTRDSSR